MPVYTKQIDDCIHTVVLQVQTHHIDVYVIEEYPDSEPQILGVSGSLHQADELQFNLLNDGYIQSDMSVQETLTHFNI